MSNQDFCNRHAYLSWKLIEHKILYYKPEDFSKQFLREYSISDHEFDRLEQEYLSLCSLLHIPNTVSHKDGEGSGGMMELDWTRPSVLNAYEKLRLAQEALQGPSEGRRR